MARLRGSLGNGLASIYVYLGHDNIWKTTTIENKCHIKTFWSHFCYDFITFVISTSLTFIGALAMKNINHILLIVILIGMHWLGLTLKTGFYIYLQPWVKLNDYIDPEEQSSENSCNCFGKTRLDVYKKLHYFMIAIFPLAGLVCLSYAGYITSNVYGELLE